MSGASDARTRRAGGIAAASACLAVLAGPAAAGDERILGRDDLPFARALVRNGYPDLAEEILSTIESGKTRSKEDGLLAQALRLELAEFKAYSEPDPVKQGEELKSVVNEMERFVAANPGTAAADALNDRLLELYRAFGERVAAMLSDPNFTGDIKSLLVAGDEMFKRAIDSLKAEREAIEAQRGALVDPDPELDRRAMLAAYNLTRAYYFHAQLLDDEFQKNTRLKNALGVLQDIQLEFSDQLLCYEGYIYEGLSLKDLKRPDDALVAFDYAIGLRDTYEQTGAGVYQIAPDAADIVSSAVLQKVLLLLERGDAKAANEVAADFFATIPDAGRTLKGLAVLSQQATALKTLGDQKGVEAVAAKLIELDPRGAGGEHGRELLGAASSGSLGAVDTYQLADSAARRGELERAIGLCQETMIRARGTADEANLGAQASLLLGVLFAQRGWMHEAVVAWAGVTERYGKGKEAPECLWRAANGYQALHGQERGTFYKEGAREVMSQLSARYPDHKYASMAAIIEGQQLEADEQFEQAAEVYARIPAGSAGHEESLYRAGNAWAGQMRKALRENKPDVAKAASAKAEDFLKKARATLEKAAGETLDVAAQERMRGLAFNARVALANLYLTPGADKAGSVAALFEGVEREFAGDIPKLTAARAQRLRALLALGKTDEAALLLDQQLRDDPNGRGLGTSAAILARAFDSRGVALREKEVTSVEAETLLRKAANYYAIAIRGQVEGSEAVRLDELEPIANRLFALALQSNGVPDEVESFTEGKGTKIDDPLLDLVVRAYEAVLTVTPSYRTHIRVARALGFMHRWEDAAEGYARLFEREPLANLSTRTIDNTVLSAKPELGLAFLEWGVCEREIGVARNAPDRLARASTIFEALIVGTRPESKVWWPAKFFHIQSLSDRGEYELAKIAIGDLERNYDDYGGGPMKERFERLAKELEKK